MNKLSKILWVVTSYVPLGLIAAISLIINQTTSSKIPNGLNIAIAFFIYGIVSVIVFGIIMIVAKKHCGREKLNIKGAKAGDNIILSNTIMYILPLVTISIGSVNLWIFLTMISIVVLISVFSRGCLYNPLVYLWKYRYYEIQVESGMTYMLLAKQKRFNKDSKMCIIELFDEIYMEV